MTLSEPFRQKSVESYLISIDNGKEPTFGNFDSILAWVLYEVQPPRRRRRNVVMQRVIVWAIESRSTLRTMPVFGFDTLSSFSFTLSKDLRRKRFIYGSDKVFVTCNAVSTKPLR